MLLPPTQPLSAQLPMLLPPTQPQPKPLPHVLANTRAIRIRAISTPLAPLRTLCPSSPLARRRPATHCPATPRSLPSQLPSRPLLPALSLPPVLAAHAANFSNAASAKLTQTS